jgi:thymidine kinase
MKLDKLLKEVMEKIEIFPGFDMIIGPMYSGKTNAYINIFNQDRTALRVAIQNMGLESDKALINRAIGHMVRNYKLCIDNRYSRTDVSTHDKLKMRASKVIDIKNAEEEVLEDLENHPYVRVLGFSELQFWPTGIKKVILDRKDKIKIVGEGLSEDYLRNPFEPVAELMPFAKIDWRPAKCDYIHDNGDICGREARHTQRLVDGHPAGLEGRFGPRIVVGSTKEVGKKLGKEKEPLVTYVPRCFHHHFVPGKDKMKTVVRYYKN